MYLYLMFLSLDVSWVLGSYQRFLPSATASLFTPLLTYAGTFCVNISGVFPWPFMISMAYMDSATRPKEHLILAEKPGLGKRPTHLLIEGRHFDSKVTAFHLHLETITEQEESIVAVFLFETYEGACPESSTSYFNYLYGHALHHENSALG